MKLKILFITLIFMGCSEFVSPDEKNTAKTDVNDIHNDSSRVEKNISIQRFISGSELEGIDNKGVFLINSMRQFDSLNIEIYDSTSQRWSPENVNFGEISLILFYAGEKTSGGFSTSIDLVEEDTSNATLNLITYSPSCGGSLGFSDPYSIYQLESTNKHIEFNFVDSLLKCPY